MRRLSIKPFSNYAVRITRAANSADRLVYIAVTNKSIHYQYGNSSIAYIGTTRKGAHRIAASAATISKKLFALHGVTAINFHIVTCRPRKRVATWRKLERALLLNFREKFGEVPKCNNHGKKMKWTDEKEYFSEARLRSVVTQFSGTARNVS